MNPRVRSGLVNCAWYSAKIVLFFLGVIVFTLVVLYKVYHSVPDLDFDRASSLAKAAGLFVLRFLPLVPMSFAVGYNAPGSRYRLAWRIVQNIYLALLIVMIGGSTGFDLIGINAEVESGTVLKDLSLRLGTGNVCLIVLVAPVCSAIDAVIEYRQNSGGDARPDEGR